MRKKWIERILAEKKKGGKPRKPPVMRPKSELDCPHCLAEKGKEAKRSWGMPEAWSERKGRGGRRKRNSTEGYFCSNKECEYYKIADEGMHALVWGGRHGKQEEIRDLRCQACGRTQEMAYGVVHELKRRLKIGCVPVFSTDGLKHYYYALTAHFGRWEVQGGKKPVWVLMGELLYAQVIKHQRRRRTVEVERRMLVGEEGKYRKRLKAGGLSGEINTSFVERLNLTIRQNVSKLTRRT